ncbi:uncharacterized protein BP5553_03437 [Venustampulla echinocandica]|uniref:DUF1279 domain-containing protein n=1 Tax=Venustampulla echinocandica TaxID=2656787 RepID=A0A370TU90_9HELO|nr:uncharacterized protein BP5553_03437 [Venustampulla echinocandica]RDL39097.1 hypothetical protein BP5553_03437 [Venustampulla echinocandica]
MGIAWAADAISAGNWTLHQLAPRFEEFPQKCTNKYLLGEWEHIVVSNVEKAIPESVKQKWHDWRTSMKKAEHEITGSEQINDTVEMAGWGVEEAEEKNKKHASLATQLALAYAIHKSFIFIRVPLAAAITPKVVRVLRGWGWDIGKRTTKEAKAINRASRVPKTKKS